MWGYQAALIPLEGRGYKFKGKPANTMVFFCLLVLFCFLFVCLFLVLVFFLALFSCVDATRSRHK